MTRYAARRLLLAIPTLIGVTIIAFALAKAMPGNAVDILLEGASDPELRLELEQRLGLDDPMPVQYLNWLWDLLRGDLGESAVNGSSVGEQIQSRFPRTLELGLYAIFFGTLVGIPIGVLSAVYRDRWPDYVLRGFAILAVSIPFFWLATLVLVLPSKWWQWSPPTRFVSFTDDPIANLGFYLTPALLLGIGTMGGAIMRISRTSMLEVVNADYIRTARAKGLPEYKVIGLHGLRNAMIPIVTVIGLTLPLLIGGSVIAETIFSIPGLGIFTTQAIGNRDEIVLQSVTVIFGGVIILGNLLVDLSYSVLDPRIRYG